MSSISIIIPIFNEIKKLPTLLKQLEPYKYKNQIIIINDGSYDGSKEFLDLQNNITIIHHKKNFGKGAAVQTALKKVKERTVMIADGDLEIDFKSLRPLILSIKSEQIVTGYRYSKDKNRYSLNDYGSLWLNYIFNLIFASNFKDILCCIKIIPTKTIKSFNLCAKGFDLETEIMAKICMHNIKSSQKKVIYNRRSVKEGKKLRITDSLFIIKKMISIRFDMWIINNQN
jgi:glycosyltransferase involved in cell wall biosynthesis